jgi:hypothetical protein
MHLYTESLEIFRKEGHPQGMASGLHNLGLVALERGDPAEARAILLESLEIFRSLGARWNVGDVVAGLACVEVARGRLEDAARLFGAADRIHTSLDAGNTLGEPANVAAWQRARTKGLHLLGSEVWERLYGEGQALSDDEAIEMAREGRL